MTTNQFSVFMRKRKNKCKSYLTCMLLLLPKMPKLQVNRISQMFSKQWKNKVNSLKLTKLKRKSINAHSVQLYLINSTSWEVICRRHTQVSPPLTGRNRLRGMKERQCERLTKLLYNNLSKNIPLSIIDQEKGKGTSIKSNIAFAKLRIPNISNNHHENITFPIQPNPPKQCK